MAIDAPDTLVKALRQSAPFSSVPLEELHQLLRGAEMQTFRAGALIYEPGDPVQGPRVLLNGRVEIYVLDIAGRRMVIREVTSKSAWPILGAYRLFGLDVCSHFWQARDDCETCRISEEAVFSLIRHHPECLRLLLKDTGEFVTSIMIRLSDALSTPVQVRLARFLIDNIDHHSFTLTGLTHQEVADVVGATRETVTKAFSLLQRQGIIEIHQKKVRIINMKGLEEIVAGRRDLPAFLVSGGVGIGGD